MKILAGFVLLGAPVFAQDIQVVQKIEALQDKLATEAATMKQTFSFVQGQVLNGKVIKAAPYSAEAITESTQTLADGNRIVNRTSTMQYRDSEGRERREETIGNIGGLGLSASATPIKAVFISDPVAKANYSLDPQSHTARKTASNVFTFSAAGGGTVSTGTMPMVVDDRHIAVAGGVAAAGAIMTARGGGGGGGAISYSYTSDARTADGPTKVAPNPPLNTEQLGSKMIEGVSAEGTRTTITIPAGQIGNERDIVITRERWYSPDLQMTVMTKSSDPRSGETVYRMTNISRSEPMPSLFEVPSDYTVTSPQTSPAMPRVVRKDE